MTAVAAALAWSIGMLPPTLMDSGAAIEWGNPVTWVVVGAGGLVLLLTIPTAQWTVLRHVVARAWR